MNKILFVTLARGGSKGVPGKHIRTLGNHTVLEWTIRAVKGSKHYRSGNYVVSSDDQVILMIAENHHITVTQRPPELALDTTPTLPALQHAIEAMEHARQMKYDYVVEVRATSPFKTSEDIDAAVDILIASGADSVIGVTPLDDHHPRRAKWLDADGYIQDFLEEPESGRRQDCLPKAYIRNGTIYAFKAPVTRLFGHKQSIGYVMPPERSVNIDTEMDWELCKAMVL